MKNVPNRRQRVKQTRDKWVLHHAEVENTLRDQIDQLTGQVKALTSKLAKEEATTSGEPVRWSGRHVMTQTDPAVSSEVAHLKAQLASMTSEASSKDAVISKLQTDLDKARTDLTQCNEELRQRSAEMATVVDEFQQLERELEQSEQKYRARREVDDEYAKDLEQSLGKQERHNAFLRQLLKEKENAGASIAECRERVMTHRSAECDQPAATSPTISSISGKRNDDRCADKSSYADTSGPKRTSKKTPDKNPKTGFKESNHLKTGDVPSNNNKRSSTSGKIAWHNDEFRDTTAIPGKKPRTANTSSHKPRDDNSSGTDGSTPEFEGAEVLLGAVSARLVEKGGIRGLRLTNNSSKSKTIFFSYSGETRTFDITLEPNRTRVFKVKPEHQQKKEVHLVSEIGEQKVLPLVWKTLPVLEENTAPMTPLRQSRRLKSAKKVASPGFVSSTEIR
ncbi:hypothetical protein FOZ62_014304 [Perkinsus olseni]|uniref:Uncharacterized protein n=2 Tax=Perkinsus olseni TaxID=32597 RepID=A0A7J6PU34_PEROL|nr:hypothetical protein FOZ62_014304 [Perkinsus olseni]